MIKAEKTQMCRHLASHKNAMRGSKAGLQLTRASHSSGKSKGSAHLVAPDEATAWGNVGHAEQREKERGGFLGAPGTN